MRLAAPLLLSFFFAACGAKTGLSLPDFDGAVGRDAPLDAGRDTGVPIDGGPLIDECVELPFREPPREVRVSFVGRIISADVYMLVDVTGSMSEEIDQIRRTLRDQIIPGLGEAIPDVRLSVGWHADFPFGMYGGGTDMPFALLQASTNDPDAAQSAVDRLPLLGGGDGPESQTEALYLSASGEGLTASFAGSGPIRIPASSCPAETVGYPCFRREGSRIFLLFTDWSFHNGPARSEPYTDITPPPHSYEDAVNALRRIGAKVLGFYSGDRSSGGLRDVQAIARDTNAVTPDGQPIVFEIGTDGRGLDASVIESVRTLVDEVPIDIDVLTEDVDGDDFNAVDFVAGVRAIEAIPADGAINLGDRFDNVRPGTRVTFSILLRNELIPPMEMDQSYLLRIVLRGDGVTRLQETIVQVVIPGRTGPGCPDTTSTF